MTITRSDVVNAYRFLLGREPENDTVVEAAKTGCRDIADLRRNFLHSPEFLANMEKLVMETRFPHEMNGTEQAIEVDCDSEALSQLLGKIEETWTRLGHEDPYFSVITNDDYRLDNFQQNQQAFWQSGECDAMRLRQFMKRNGISVPVGSTCLEYGCGTGRVTRWLAKDFRFVIACDISAAHLRLAREGMPGDEGSNVKFVQVSQVAKLDELPPFDVLFSIIVLQHNPPPIIAYVLDRLLERLRPGGIAYFQVPTFQPNYRFSTVEYLAPNSEWGTRMEMHVLPQRNVFDIANKHNCRPIEVSPDNMVGMDSVSTTFLLRKQP
jgi:SAM-dependent methyltransferase